MRTEQSERNDVLGRLLDSPVGVERGKLLLHALTCVGEFALAQLHNRLLDPLQKL